jgi:predicted GNAT superfamily acetyltransferase
LSEGREFIKWTWDPMQSRNAHFNLNRLGVSVHHYEANFYGLDYDQSGRRPGIPSDRLFASWRLNSPRVAALGAGLTHAIDAQPAKKIAIPSDWSAVVKRDANEARDMQARVRSEFQSAFAEQLVCAGLERVDDESRYLLYRASDLGIADFQLPIAN